MRRNENQGDMNFETLSNADLEAFTNPSDGLYEYRFQHHQQ